MILNGKAWGTLAIAALSCAIVNAQGTTWDVKGGTVVVSLHKSSLKDAGLEVRGLMPTDFGNYQQEGGIGFAISPTSSFRVSQNGATYGNYMGGDIQTQGGFYLASGKKQVGAFNMKIVASGASGKSSLLIRDGAEGATEPSLESSNAGAYLDIQKGTLTVGFGDLKITRESALKLGRPELEGLLIGTFSVHSRVSPNGKVEVPPTGGFIDGTNLDVSLHRMSSLTSMGRTGTYPNGIGGYAMSTTSCNPGDVNIWWYAPMDQRHPVIVQNMYRIKEGRLEQIGAAYLKHGFFATNTTDSTCGVGQHPGTGSLLGLGLTDTYGAGNNSDRYYLGPRSELNPLTGEWTAFGSFFDVGTGGAVPDGARSLTSGQASALPAHKNMIEVSDQELINQPTGTRFFYEAIYINPRQRVNTSSPWMYDINMYNQVGVKEVIPSYSTGSGRFTFNELNAGVTKLPFLMIQQYITAVGGSAVANMALPNSEGDIWVSCNPVNVGGGNYRYEVAVFNFTSDRQVDEVKIPILDGLTVTGIGFRDVDATAANNWAGSYANGEIKWNMPTTGTPNPLTYGYCYNFWFTANIAPQTNTAHLDLYKAPTGGSTLLKVAAGTVAPPDGNRQVDSYFVEMGVQTGGNLASLQSSDDDRLTVLQSVAEDQLYPCAVWFNSVSPIQTPSQIQFNAEISTDINNRFAYVEFYNWNTGLFESPTLNFTTMTDGSVSGTVTGAANMAKFVKAGTREIRARISIDMGSEDSWFGVTLRVDKASFKVNF